MTNKYKDDSIISLNGRDFTRLRPSTYLGSNEYSTQLVREVFSNSLDEHNIGNGNIINVRIDTHNNEYMVEDFGQGFPINVKREDGETVLQAAFDVINTSGKYDGEEGVYKASSLGTNGIGAKLTNFLSKKLEVVSYNGKASEYLLFKDGLLEKRKVNEFANHKPGTVVRWIPDEQFFQNKEANINDLKKLFEDISALCPNLTINFTVDNKNIVYHCDNGIQDLVDKKFKDKEILNNRFSIRKEVNNALFDICLTYTSDYSQTIIPYVNYGLTEGGAHIYTLNFLLAQQFNKYAHANNMFKKKDDKFSSTELSEGMTVVFNIKSTNVKYDSQTKTRIVDFDRTLMTDVIKNEFSAWLDNNPKDVKLILDRALTARKAKEAAQNAKDKIRNATNKGKKFITLPTKLIDAYSKNREECELYICEGDSALNGLVGKRDGKTQALFPIRGKILSCRKATPDKVYSNQEISNIVKALGLDIDKASGKLIYEKKKLRYNKIIIASDADDDGLNIRMLLITMFWWLCPKLIEEGHICIAIPPLFKITNKDNKYIFLKDQQELNKYSKAHKDKFTINRLKGLGEMDPSELAYCILNKDTRNIIELSVNNSKETDNLLEVFMGPKVEPRREYLLKMTEV